MVYIYICIYLLCDLTWQATSNPLARRFQPDSTQRSEKPWITVVVVSRLTYRKARFPPGCRWVRSHLEMRWDERIFFVPILYSNFFSNKKNKPSSKKCVDSGKKWDWYVFFRLQKGLVAGCGRIGIFWCEVSTLFSPPKVFPQLCQGVDLLVGAVPAICRRHPHVRWLLGLQGRNGDFRGTTQSWKMTPQRVSC